VTFVAPVWQSVL